MNLNLSLVSDHATAKTDHAVAHRRAARVAALGCCSVLELCVGPSLRTLADAYQAMGVRCVGNDIDSRWAQYYPAGEWRLGNCFTIAWTGIDCVVFAPPLSAGCTGRRADALQINQVQPAFTTFLHAFQQHSATRHAIMVLPARALATKTDRTQLHALIAAAYLVASTVQYYETVAGRRNIRKYVEVSLSK